LFTAHYSLSWAKYVVQNLHDKHARGTEDVYRLLEIDAYDMAKFLASGDPEWARVRDLCVWCDSYYKNPRLPDDRPKKRREFIEHLRRMGDKRALQRIDNIEIRHTIKEQ